MTRFYRLTHAEGGPLPEESPLRIGAIIKVDRANSLKPGPVFNHETSNWVVPKWTECADPRLEATR